MKKRIKKQWITALRSGKYQQGTETLTCDGKFCCLGVLCELALAKGVVEKDGEYYQAVGNKNDRECVTLPLAVQVWASLNSDDPKVKVGMGSSESLAFLNDNGRNFAEIADIIEANL